ncbi:eukaryotic translation initiation factor 4E type 3-B-like isoform X2 [Varroa jacobsoni]|uniref:Uncharacterized protein n=1 Tax=Varroa destructor TaxID=109461 RepID=A0A7M7K297_VARDE|nr:eukaryotic translation initiation factor 4E type 3-B-like isoform X2 [Varroa destructor]XP_022698398.1 eukaryotic translation initiation factor 4E type 3-B-like isoform X2 [Varroa jacobsoni]
MRRNDPRENPDTDCRGLSAEDYERNLKKIYTVDTVQTFWQVYNNIPSVNELGPNYSYHLMREQHRPIREDGVHKDGGAWRCRLASSDTKAIWQELLLAAIGEQLTDSDNPTELLGISVALRDGDDMIQLWHANACTEQTSKIPDRLEHVLPSGFRFLMRFYKAHHTIHPYRGGGGSSASHSGRRGSNYSPLYI